MRRRLLAVIVGTVALALAVASTIALVGIRRAQLGRTKATLVSTANQFAPSSQSRTQRGLVSVQTALGLETAAVLRYPKPGRIPDDPTMTIGLSAADIPTEVGTETPLQAGGAPLLVTDRILPADLRVVAAGGTVTGILGGQVYAVVRQTATDDNVDVLLLITAFVYDPWPTVRALLLATAIALVLASMLAIVFARRIATPLAIATDAYRRIASGDLSVRVAHRVASRAGRRGRGNTVVTSDRRDEIGELMRSLDVMADSLERAQRQEQQFLLSVSHDLRTPLTSIRGFAEAIAEGTAADQRRGAEVIAAESRRLERLVRDLLEMAKLDARRFELHPRTVDVSDLVTDTADGFLPAGERDGLVIDLEAEEGLLAVVDPERTAQVLANLIENAMKFAESRVVVAVRRQGPGRVVMSVRDDGPGISDADLPRIFERLYTSDRRSTRHIGSGLGLAIVKELCDAMGAHIEVSTGPEGSTFSVSVALLRDSPAGPGSS